MGTEQVTASDGADGSVPSRSPGLVNVRPGELERRVVAKSHGKRAYKDARNNFWGNLWPH